MWKKKRRRERNGERKKTRIDRESSHAIVDRISRIHDRPCGVASWQGTSEWFRTGPSYTYQPALRICIPCIVRAAHEGKWNRRERYAQRWTSFVRRSGPVPIEPDRSFLPLVPSVGTRNNRRLESHVIILLHSRYYDEFPGWWKTDFMVANIWRGRERLAWLCLLIAYWKMNNEQARAYREIRNRSRSLLLH